MIPRPPIWIRITSMIFPATVNWSAGTIVTSPVTHTLVTEVKSASINSIGFWLLNGSQRSTPPRKITPKNPSATSCIVFKRTRLALFFCSSI